MFNFSHCFVPSLVSSNSEFHICHLLNLLTEAIKLCYCDVELLDTINKVYNILGHRYSCSPEKIKSSLRSIVKTANRFTDTTILNSMFYIDSDKKLSTKYFINGIILKLKE